MTTERDRALQVLQRHPPTVNRLVGIEVDGKKLGAPGRSLHVYRRHITSLEGAMRELENGFGGDFVGVLFNGDYLVTRLENTPYWPTEWEPGGAVELWRIWWLLRNAKEQAEEHLAQLEKTP